MKFFLFAMGLCALVFTSCTKPSLKTDDDKVIYAVGFDMGSKTKKLELTPREIEILKMGIQEGTSGGESRIKTQDYIAKIGKFLGDRQKKSAQKESKKAQAFLDKAKSEKGAEITESGLIYIEKTPGTGPSPKAESTVKVHYHGTLRDNTVFDSSKDRGTPTTFPLKGVIPCWTEGVQKMKVGGKSELYCPSKLAYKSSGVGKIPPGAALKFEVELLEIVPTKNVKKGKKKR